MEFEVTSHHFRPSAIGMIPQLVFLAVVSGLAGGSWILAANSRETGGIAALVIAVIALAGPIVYLKRTRLEVDDQEVRFFRWFGLTNRIDICDVARIEASGWSIVFLRDNPDRPLLFEFSSRGWRQDTISRVAEEIGVPVMWKDLP